MLTGNGKVVSNVKNPQSKVDVTLVAVPPRRFKHVKEKLKQALPERNGRVQTRGLGELGRYSVCDWSPFAITAGVEDLTALQVRLEEKPGSVEVISKKELA